LVLRTSLKEIPRIIIAVRYEAQPGLEFVFPNSEEKIEIAEPKQVEFHVISRSGNPRERPIVTVDKVECIDSATEFLGSQPEGRDSTRHSYVMSLSPVAVLSPGEVALQIRAVEEGVTASAVLKARVRPAIEVSPSSVFMSETATVVLKSDRSFNITSITTSEFLSVATQQKNDSLTVHQLDVRRDGLTHTAELRTGEIVIETDHPGGGQLRVPVIITQSNSANGQ